MRAGDKLGPYEIAARGYLYDVSADGQKFLVADEGVATTRPLTLLQNWPATLRK